MNFSSAAKVGATVLGLGLYGCACYFGTNAILAPMFNKKPEIETIWDNVKNEYTTYKEIKQEGIKASSYEEAKQKLDSIKEDRLFRKYGIEAPSENATAAEKLSKQLELQIKLNEESQNQLNEIINSPKLMQ